MPCSSATETKLSSAFLFVAIFIFLQALFTSPAAGDFEGDFHDDDHHYDGRGGHQHHRGGGGWSGPNGPFSPPHGREGEGHSWNHNP